jgi:ATP-dependent Lon protease
LNEKDVAEVPKYALEGMKIHYVSHVDDVFDLALEGGAKQAAVAAIVRKKNAGTVLKKANRKKATSRKRVR